MALMMMALDGTRKASSIKDLSRKFFFYSKLLTDTGLFFDLQMEKMINSSRFFLI